MAERDNFIGWSIVEKMELYRGMQEAFAAGVVTRVSTGRGVETQFDPTQPSAEEKMRKLEISLLNDPHLAEVDPNGEIRAALEGNQRQIQTSPIFH
jgi:hypothetical protein